MWKKIKKNKKYCYTEVTIKDYAPIIREMGPVKVFLNDTLIWDDDTDPLSWFNELMEKEILITGIMCDVTMFHHAEIHIYTR